MIFEPNHLYHIYNQGNNKQLIFFARENYLYFLQKINKHILTYADILAWCLMPNHFHLLVYVKDTHQMSSGVSTHQMTPSHQMSNKQEQQNHQMSNELTKSIATLLRSYTRAINIQEKRTGSLFKPHTKAQCLTKAESITPAYFNSSFGTYLNLSIPEREYPQLCFDYIHNNPTKANLVKQAEDWEFSSYKDYCGLRNGKLINRERATEYGLLLNSILI